MLIARPTERQIPDSMKTVAFTAPSGLKAILKVPSALSGMKLLKAMDATSLTAIVSSGTQISDLGSLALIKSSGPEMLTTLGSVVGMAWYDKHHDLPVPVPGRKASPDDWHEFGETVYESLHEHGFTFSDVLCMAIAVIGEWVGELTLHQEAAERADFFAQKMASLTTPSSTSESTS
jgi:hypothetical protein